MKIKSSSGVPFLSLGDCSSSVSRCHCCFPSCQLEALSDGLKFLFTHMPLHITVSFRDTLRVRCNRIRTHFLHLVVRHCKAIGTLLLLLSSTAVAVAICRSSRQKPSATAAYRGRASDNPWCWPFHNNCCTANRSSSRTATPSTRRRTSLLEN
jgi:hypothetical protein